MWGIENMAIERTEEQVVAIVVAGFEWLWQNGDEYDQWDYLRSCFHGAMVAMIGTGMKEAEQDFLTLRDVAKIRGQMKEDEQ